MSRIGLCCLLVLGCGGGGATSALPDAASDGAAAAPEAGANAQALDASADAALDAMPKTDAGEAPDSAMAAMAVMDAGADAVKEAAVDAQPPLEAGAEVAPGVFTCAKQWQPPANGLCEVLSGDSSASHLLLQGHVLAEDGVYLDGALLIDRDSDPDNATFACVGCGCGAQAVDAQVVRCAGSVLSPGLINAHDHLPFALNQPSVPGAGERFDHRDDWRRGEDGHTEVTSAASHTREAVMYGELRMLMSGVTSIAGSSSGNDALGLVRNLDRADYDGGLTTDPARLSTFPLGDIVSPPTTLACTEYSIDPVSRLEEPAYVAHAAMGIDARSQPEFTCLSSDAGGGTDLLADNTALVGGAALTAADVLAMSEAGAALVWSPRSDIALYGRTADVRLFQALDVRVALATGWVVQGSMNMLRELRCAEDYDEAYLGGQLSAEGLWRMATANGADALAVEDRLGHLSVGRIADVAVFAGNQLADHGSLLAAGPADVALVLRGGQPLYGQSDVVQSLRGAACEGMDVCGSPRAACVDADTEDGLTLSDLTGIAGAYPLFACGQPAAEPTCTPLRPGEYTGETSPTDADGDAVPDADDNCPGVFNPARPFEAGTQADADGDDIGDACDPCPAGPSCTMP